MVKLVEPDLMAIHKLEKAWFNSEFKFQSLKLVIDLFFAESYDEFELAFHYDFFNALYGYPLLHILPYFCS